MSLFDESSFAPSYLSMEEISATQIKIPCRTLIRLGRFGYLDPTAGQQDLPAGSQLELPYWAALALVKRGYVSVAAPQKFRGMYREMLKADPTVMDLCKIAPHFYQSGLHIASLPTPDSPEIAEILPDVLQRRLVTMVDSFNFMKELRTAGESGMTGTLMTENQMDELEKGLFKSSKKSAEAISDWLRDG